jgi:transcriptional regulator with XRE-family HTH domain
VGNASDRKPTEIGYYLLRAMRDAGIPSAAQLARAAKVSGSTLSRIMYDGVAPDPSTLDRLADALVAASQHRHRTAAALEKAQREARLELWEVAGYGVAAVGRRVDPQALEIDQLIGDGTPLTPDEVQYLRNMLNHLVAPYVDRLLKRTG